jgi:hypothetical protein
VARIVRLLTARHLACRLLRGDLLATAADPWPPVIGQPPMTAAMM